MSPALTLARHGALAATFALFASSAHAAVLAGQMVSANAHSVDIAFNVTDGPVVTVAAPGTATLFGGFLSAVYADKQITVTDLLPSTSISFFTSNFLTGVPFSFNGLHFDVPMPVFTSLLIDPASTVAGAGAFFNGNEIWLDLKGLTFNTGDTVILDINGGPGTGVPEPEV
jgi:hypothetical protein